MCPPFSVGFFGVFRITQSLSHRTDSKNRGKPTAQTDGGGLGFFLFFLFGRKERSKEKPRWEKEKIQPHAQAVPKTRAPLAVYVDRFVKLRFFREKCGKEKRRKVGCGRNIGASLTKRNLVMRRKMSATKTPP